MPSCNTALRQDSHKVVNSRSGVLAKFAMTSAYIKVGVLRVDARQAFASVHLRGEMSRVGSAMLKQMVSLNTRRRI